MTTPPPNTLQKLEALGYAFTLDGGSLRYTFTLPGEPPSEAAPLLARLRDVKGYAVRFLRKRAALADAGRLMPLELLGDYCQENGLRVVRHLGYDHEAVLLEFGPAPLETAMAARTAADGVGGRQVATPATAMPLAASPESE